MHEELYKPLRHRIIRSHFLSEQQRGRTRARVTRVRTQTNSTRRGADLSRHGARRWSLHSKKMRAQWQLARSRRLDEDMLQYSTPPRSCRASAIRDGVSDLRAPWDRKSGCSARRHCSSGIDLSLRLSFKSINPSASFYKKPEGGIFLPLKRWSCPVFALQGEICGA